MEQMRKDLDEIMTAVRSLNGAMHYMSQRVAWSEICFKKVQDSGVIQMTDMLKKVMDDHRKLMLQVNILSTRLAAMQQDSGSSSDAPRVRIVVASIEPRTRGRR